MSHVDGKGEGTTPCSEIRGTIDTKWTQETQGQEQTKI